MHHIAIFSNHTLDGFILAAVANCAITSLPSPTATSNSFYKWFFAFSHSLVLAIPRILDSMKQQETPKQNGD